MTTITDHNICVGCQKPAGPSQKIGDPCPHDCKHCLIVRSIEQGRYAVEICTDGKTQTGATQYMNDGFIGDMLSREYNSRRYVSLGAAEHQAFKWLGSKQ